MMENVMKDMQELIRKNLPQEVGENLKEVLRQAEADRTTVGAQLKIIRDLKEELEELKRLKNSYDDLNKRKDELYKKEAELKEKEQTLKVKELEYQLASEKEKTTMIKEVALGLVRNIEYRGTALGNDNNPNGYTSVHRDITTKAT